MKIFSQIVMMLIKNMENFSLIFSEEKQKGKIMKIKLIMLHTLNPYIAFKPSYIHNRHAGFQLEKEENSFAKHGEK